MNLALEGKKVLISGGSRGIGFSIAENFLKEGAIVGLVARGKEELNFSEKKLSARFGAEKVFCWSCNVSNLNEVVDLRKSILSMWDFIDCLILNVGSGESVLDPIPSEANWSQIWDTNFNSALFLCRDSIDNLLTSSKGSIVFVSSICGIEALGAPTDYSVAKAALLALSKNLSRKLAPKIRVNAVAPGNIFFPNGTWDMKIKQNESLVNKMLAKEVPLKRFGTPEEIADSVVFLSSERASFITGETLIVDGGQTRSIQ
jgi:3-oxoacyl-[acyl-carrier protein] reductase